MIKHFRWHLTNFLALKIGFPYQPGSAAEIDSYLCQTVVHRKTKSIPLNPTLIAKRFHERFAKCQRSVLNGMMLINMQITLNGNLEINFTVTCQLIKHVIKETQPGMNF